MAIRMLTLCFVGWLVPISVLAETYYVDPAGDDTRDGTSPKTAWCSVARVNGNTFRPGDHILFARDAEWHECLRPNCSGAEDKPIVFDAYGQGRKPKFWGSDVLLKDKWQSEGNSIYVYKSLPPVTQVLANHGTESNGQWFASSDGRPIANSAGKLEYRSGELRINSTTDPRSDSRTYTAIVRQDVINSNGKDHLVFRNLQGDETADPNDGYVFRVMGSKDVMLEDCEAYRGGRHNFGVINSTEIIGHRLRAAYAMANVAGGATFYVTYSGAESKYSNCTCSWVDCSGEHFENGLGGKYQFFVCHGEKQGPISFVNPIVRGGKFSVLQDNPAQIVSVTGGLIEDADYELFCSHSVTDGVTFTGNSSVDCWGCDNVFQNLKIMTKLKDGGPTGYRTAVLMREKAQRNILRFSTIVIDRSQPTETACLTLLGSGSGTQWYGNVLMTNGRAVSSNAPLTENDAKNSDYNFYSPNATFNDLALTKWKAHGFADQHSLSGDPKFTKPDANDFTLQPSSPAIATVPLTGKLVPEMDFNWNKRPSGASDMGAFQSTPQKPK